MICPTCQREIADYSNFCYFCGTRQGSGVPSRRLMRSVVDSKIAGVCGGFADYFNSDSTVVRILFVFLTIATGLVPGIVAYVVAWILMPQAPYVSSPAGVANTAAPGSGQR
ncbi:MAG: PspC domain-containing protein [Acidobacteriota bacterium]|nr:PspC domain-containing protein [Acidobacteriota bacterium]